MTIGSALGIVAVIAMGVRDYLDRQTPTIELDDCCSGGLPRRAADVEVPEVLSGGDVEAGHRLYVAACANCHDADGSGTNGRRRYPAVRDLRRGLTPEALATAVVRGYGEMPAFGGLLKTQDVRDLLAYIADLKPGPATDRD